MPDTGQGGQCLSACLALLCGGSAAAQSDAVRGCADQTEAAATPRIAACSALLKPRLAGKPAGVAYALRGLAYLDRGDIPNAIADLDKAIALAPDFAASLSEPRQCLVRARQFRPRHRRLRQGHPARSEQSLPPTATAPPCGATSATIEGAHRGLRQGDQPRRATAPVPMRGRGELYLRQRRLRARNRRLQSRRCSMEPRRRHFMLRGRGARARRRFRPRARPTMRRRRGSIRQTCGAQCRKANILRRKGELDARDFALRAVAKADQNNRRRLTSCGPRPTPQKGDRKRALQGNRPRAEVHLERRGAEGPRAAGGLQDGDTRRRPAPTSTYVMKTLSRRRARAWRCAARWRPAARITRPRASRSRQGDLRSTRKTRSPTPSAAWFSPQRASSERAFADLNRAHRARHQRRCRCLSRARADLQGAKAITPRRSTISRRRSAAIRSRPQLYSERAALRKAKGDIDGAIRRPQRGLARISLKN